jgi:flagellar protein FliS
MANQYRARDRYVEDGVSSASQYQLISMLYERVLRDLHEAENGILTSAWDKVNTSLCHAQDIIIELRASLKPEEWSGGPGLLALYDYLIEQLVQANVRKQRSTIVECRKIVEPLSDAWKQVAVSTEGTGVMGSTPYVTAQGV